MKLKMKIQRTTQTPKEDGWRTKAKRYEMLFGIFWRIRRGGVREIGREKGKGWLIEEQERRQILPLKRFRL